jgi:dienelactone hydrolase
MLLLLLLLLPLQGSGLSDGKWVTLGAHEVDDLAVVVEHLRRQGGVSSIGLWGRSMGAVTALLYSSKDPDIAGMAAAPRVSSGD